MPVFIPVCLKPCFLYHLPFSDLDHNAHFVKLFRIGARQIEEMFTTL